MNALSKSLMCVLTLKCIIWQWHWHTIYVCLQKCHQAHFLSVWHLSIQLSIHPTSWKYCALSMFSNRTVMCLFQFSLFKSNPIIKTSVLSLFWLALSWHYWYCSALIWAVMSTCSSRQHSSKCDFKVSRIIWGLAGRNVRKCGGLGLTFCLSLKMSFTFPILTGVPGGCPPLKGDIMSHVQPMNVDFF